MSLAVLRSFALGLCAVALGAAAPARAQDADAALGFERTPPRLSFTDGEVSFLRPGAEDWTPALVNTALAAGDELYTGAAANLELQIGARAFVRAGENTQMGLTSLEPDFLQLRLTSGHLSLDLRSLTAGQTLELSTPNAAFTVERSGYYRIEVDGETTTFASRRGGRATLTPAAGDTLAIAASEQVVVTGTDAPQIASYAAPELDAWDRWNYARTDDQIEAVSARYVPSGVYGTDDLDHHGDWRVVPSYGAVWVPRGVAAGWAPYSSGRWIYDPYYSWTWVDSAPWGWAPYHYGRWVRVSGYWGWCPGPIVYRPYYSPALVAFYGGGFSVGFGYGAPHVGWVALGWGEPVVRWWGPSRYRGHAYWGGWGGPHVVNKVVIKNKTVIKGDQINVFQNADVRGAIVGVDRNRFGRRSRDGERYSRLQGDNLRPLRGDLGVRPDRSSLVAEQRSAQRPPRESSTRSVVATRQPRGAGAATLRTRVVQPAREGRRIAASQRPAFGTQSDRERRTPEAAPRFERAERTERASRSATLAQRRPAPPSERQRGSRRETAAAPAAPRPDARASARSRSESTARVEPARPERGRSSRARELAAPSSARELAVRAPRNLPGEPANRVYQPRAAREQTVARESPRAERPQANRASRGDLGQSSWASRSDAAPSNMTSGGARGERGGGGGGGQRASGGGNAGGGGQRASAGSFGSRAGGGGWGRR